MKCRTCFRHRDGKRQGIENSTSKKTEAGESRPLSLPGIADALRHNGMRIRASIRPLQNGTAIGRIIRTSDMHCLSRGQCCQFDHGIDIGVDNDIDDSESGSMALCFFCMPFEQSLTTKFRITMPYAPPLHQAKHGNRQLPQYEAQADRCALAMRANKAWKCSIYGHLLIVIVL